MSNCIVGHPWAVSKVRLIRECGELVYTTRYTILENIGDVRRWVEKQLLCPELACWEVRPIGIEFPDIDVPLGESVIVVSVAWWPPRGVETQHKWRTFPMGTEPEKILAWVDEIIGGDWKSLFWLRVGLPRWLWLAARLAEAERGPRGRAKHRKDENQ